MGRMDCTEPQCLYKGALYLTSVPVQWCTLPYLSACTRVHFNFTFTYEETVPIFCAGPSTISGTCSKGVYRATYKNDSLQFSSTFELKLPSGYYQMVIIPAETSDRVRECLRKPVTELGSARTTAGLQRVGEIRVQFLRTEGRKNHEV